MCTKAPYLQVGLACAPAHLGFNSSGSDGLGLKSSTGGRGHAVEVGSLHVAHVVLARAVQAHQVSREVLTVAHLWANTTQVTLGASDVMHKLLCKHMHAECPWCSFGCLAGHAKKI